MDLSLSVAALLSRSGARDRYDSMEGYDSDPGHASSLPERPNTFPGSGGDDELFGMRPGRLSSPARPSPRLRHRSRRALSDDGGDGHNIYAQELGYEVLKKPENLVEAHRMANNYMVGCTTHVHGNLFFTF